MNADCSGGAGKKKVSERKKNYVAQRHIDVTVYW